MHTSPAFSHVPACRRAPRDKARLRPVSGTKTSPMIGPPERAGDRLEINQDRPGIQSNPRHPGRDDPTIPAGPSPSLSRTWRLPGQQSKEIDFDVDRQLTKL